MNTKIRISFSRHLLVSFALFATLFLIVGRLSAQKPSSGQKNSDGSTTSSEDLPGGGQRATTKDANGKVIEVVTSEPDSTYGKGGQKLTLRTDDEGYDIETLLYLDASGNVRRLTYTDYGPEDKIGLKYEMDVKFNEKEEMQSFEEKRNNKSEGEKDVAKLDPDAWRAKLDQIKGDASLYKETAESTANRRLSRWISKDLKASLIKEPSEKPSEKTTPKTETPSTPPPTKTNGDSSMPEPSTSAEVVEGKVPGYSATVTTPTGLFTTVMTTPSKDVIEIYLPRNLVAGDTVLGSMKVTPAEPNRPLIPVEFRIGLGETIALKNGPFTAKLDDQPVTKLRLLDQKDQTLTGIDFNTGAKPKNSADFIVASSGTYGTLIDVGLPNHLTTYDLLKCRIGGQNMPIIAASPADVVTRIDYDKPGLTEIEIKDGNTDYKRPFRVLKLDLSADKLNLVKNESTTVHIVVHGLENLHVPAHMKIVVKGAVTMTGATEVEIRPSDVSADGTYTTTRTLDAVSAGGFGVNVTVTVDKEIPVVKSNQKGESNRSRLFLSDKLQFVDM